MQSFFIDKNMSSKHWGLIFIFSFTDRRHECKNRQHCASISRRKTKKDEEGGED